MDSDESYISFSLLWGRVVQKMAAGRIEMR
jgi:hypothetical protein